LTRNWTLWYDCKSARSSGSGRQSIQQYENQIKEIGFPRTVEAFWRYANHTVPPSGIEAGANYHFFKEGVKPTWEDVVNTQGGKWDLTVGAGDRGNLDQWWTTVLMGLVGELLDIDGDVICGAVFSRRKKGDRLAVWTRMKDDRVRNLGVAKRLLEILDLQGGRIKFDLQYKHHNDTMKSGRSYNATAHLGKDDVMKPEVLEDDETYPPLPKV